MFEFWCDYDINPLIIFNEKGYVKYCNQEAEIVLSYINKKEIYEFVIKNAPKEKGIKTEFRNIKFNNFEFKGFSIGYENDKNIGIRLFINTNKHNIELKDLEKIELSMLIDFVIEYIALKEKINITKNYDPSIPPLLINKKALLNTLLEIVENQKKATISTKIEIGEYIKIKNKKYPVIDIIINTNSKKEITSPYFEVLNNKNEYIIKIPLIKEIDENNHT